MSLSASVVWEVRPSSGSSSNGGGFDNSVSSPGTDYSQQNAAQITYSDLVIQATNTQLKSSANPFTSAHVGNIIQVTGGTGFTTGFYTVLSVTSNVATMDRAVGTANSTGGTGNLGGALAALSNLFTSSSATTIAITGNTVWMTGTLTVTTATDFAFTNAADLRISIRGYGTVRGDGTNATITTSTNSIHLIQLHGITGLEFRNITFSSTAGTPGNGIHAFTSNSALVSLQNCLLTGLNIGIDGNFAVDYCIVNLHCIEVEIKSCVAQGIINSGNTYLYGCYLHNNGSDGCQITSTQGAGVYAAGTVFSSNTGAGFHDNASASNRMSILVNCVFYNNTSDGVTINNSASCQNAIIINCIHYNNGGYGQNWQSAASGANPAATMIQRKNAFGSNTSGARNNTAFNESDDITLTANPFNNASGGDFSLNSTSGGGSSCSGAGWQSGII